uniref:GNAT family N-acetyltransferase n=1 Tax=Pedobacter schmidteae TaxID=2201271 RepID=UPI000EAB9AAB|nr:GNAT family N-acetyltransferase [Pedobacter schmidteae]
MNIQINSIDNTYCEQIIGLILPIQQIEFNVPVTLNDQPDLLDIESNYHKDGGNFWGARYGEELVGTIAMINTGHRASALRKMFVKKEFRGKEYGIAQRLLDTYIQFCRDNEITDIYLGTVDLLKAAHRFYEKNGFEKIAADILPSYFPRMKADNIFYHLQV